MPDMDSDPSHINTPTVTAILTVAFVILEQRFPSMERLHAQIPNLTLLIVVAIPAIHKIWTTHQAKKARHAKRGHRHDEPV